MATQGLLSIVQGGQVMAKVIAGADGYNIPHLARALRADPTTDAHELLRRANLFDMGGPSLIVQTSADTYLSEEAMDVDELPEWYRTKFDDPQFNPRWAHGTAEYTEIVEL